jgi:hypothetical protein
MANTQFPSRGRCHCCGWTHTAIAPRCPNRTLPARGYTAPPVPRTSARPSSPSANCGCGRSWFALPKTWGLKSGPSAMSGVSESASKPTCRVTASISRRMSGRRYGETGSPAHRPAPQTSVSSRELTCEPQSPRRSIAAFLIAPAGCESHVWGLAPRTCRAPAVPAARPFPRLWPRPPPAGPAGRGPRSRDTSPPGRSR